MEATVIVGLVGAGVAALTFVLGQRSAAKKEGETDGDQKARLEAVERDIKELKIDFKRHADLDEARSKRLAELDRELVRLQEQFKNFDKRLDMIWGEIRGMLVPHAMADMQKK